MKKAQSKAKTFVLIIYFEVLVARTTSVDFLRSFSLLNCYNKNQYNIAIKKNCFPHKISYDFSEECGALESVKAASELISPVSGKVVEKNEAVESKPSLINSSCYKEGWLFKVELSDADEIKSLMSEEAYNTFLKSDAR